MSEWPVAFSLMASFMSAITLLGVCQVQGKLVHGAIASAVAAVKLFHSLLLCFAAGGGDDGGAGSGAATDGAAAVPVLFGKLTV